MKKRVALIAIICLMSIMAVACSRNCKVKGCSKEIYEDGLCLQHSLEKTVEDGLKELEGLFN